MTEGPDSARDPLAPAGEVSGAEVPPAGLEAARLDVRRAGYCVFCDEIVERTPEGGCAKGHPAEGISGRIVLDDDEPVPVLPRFNLAAFLIPMIWGPANGLWAGAIFLPLWLFTDSIVRSSAQMGVAGRVAAAGAVVMTLAMAAWFGKRANGLAWRRVCGRVGVADFAARQRLWAVFSVPIAAVLVGMALYFNIVILPERGM